MVLSYPPGDEGRWNTCLMQPAQTGLKYLAGVSLSHGIWMGANPLNLRGCVVSIDERLTTRDHPLRRVEQHGYDERI